MSWTVQRVTLETSGRWLAAHSGELDEWGITGGLKLEPDAKGRGLSLRVQPRWGAVGSGTSRLWEEGMVGRGGPVEERSGAMVVEAGYGLAAFGGSGVATPYSRFGLAQEERRYGLGWRLIGPEEALELDLEAYRSERRTERPGHGVELLLRLRW